MSYDAIVINAAAYLAVIATAVAACSTPRAAKPRQPQIQTWSQAALRARIQSAWYCSDQGIHAEVGGSTRPGHPSAEGIAYAAGSSPRSRMVIGGPSTDRRAKSCADLYRDALCAAIAQGAGATAEERRSCAGR